MDNNDNNENKKTYIYTASGCIIAGAVAIGLSFTVLGEYLLLVSMFLSVTAVTFLNLQKKMNNFKWLIYLQVTAYAVFAAAILLFFLL